MSIGAITGSFLPGGDRNAWWIMQRWAQFLVRIAGVRPEVSGAANVVDGPQIFVANHQGNCDIVLLSGYMPRQFQWIAKQELFRVPVFGRAMLRAGHVPINRGSRDDAYSSLDAAAQAIRAGRSVMIFPEGTRSRSGEMGQFKRGTSYLALKSGAPIVPVFIEGSRGRMLPGTYSVHPGPARMTIWPARPTADLSQEEILTLLCAIRDEMQQAMDQSDLIE